MARLNGDGKMDPRFKLMLLFAAIGVVLIIASILVSR